jgi:transposase
MYFVGLDVHARRSSLCIVDHAGRSVKRLEVRGTWPKLLDEVAASVPRPFAVCYEASCGYGYLHERLSRLAERVAVAHPGKLRLIYGDKRKNDRVDAQKLAKLLCLDAVPAVHVPPADVRAWRGLIEARRRLLRTIPGVGVRTAEAVVAYLDDVRRFARVKQVGCYLGLVPCQDTSAGRDRLGHITGDGPPTVRKLLCESAWQAVRRSPAMKAYFERVTRGDKDRKKIALVATAHKLARAMAAMLRSGESWGE